MFLSFQVYLPTKSTRHTLSIASHGWFFPDRPVITLQHYVNDVHVRDYILAIESGISYQEPQFYELPNIDHGTIEVVVDLGEEAEFILVYNKAEDLYKRGLLIYLNGNRSDWAVAYDYSIFDKYAYFVSGRKEICYYQVVYFQQKEFVEQVNASEWSPVTDPPPMKIISLVDLPYYIFYSGWKENKWVIEEVVN